MNPLKAALLWAGLVIIAAGIVTGLMPMTSNTISCGSAFASSDAAPSELENTDCDSMRSLARVPAVILLVFGGGLLAAGTFQGTGGGVDMRGHRMVLGKPVGKRDDAGEE